MSGTFTHFVFVDFENVPKVDLSLIEGKAVQVILLIGKKQTWLDLSLVQQLRRLGNQVELIEVGASGHNALDLTLAYHLGVTVQQWHDAQFFIVSKDKDFDPLIAHLQEKVGVSRYDSFASLPLFAPVKKAPALRPASPAKLKAAPNNLEKFIAHLRRGLPTNRTKLEHAITAFFKPSLPAGGMKGVIAELEKRKVLLIDGEGKVTSA